LLILPEELEERGMRWIVLCLGIFGYLGAGASTSARDLGQWENGDPGLKQWYQALMQPDVPSASCCGEADAYWADEIHVRNGKTYAIVTDIGPTSRVAGPTSTSEPKLKSPTTNSNGTNRIPPGTASYS
jgi:hypothetical protein